MILTFLASEVPLMESGRLPTLAYLRGTHYLTIEERLHSAFQFFYMN